MDLSNAILTSVYPHGMGDANNASSTLMGNMADQVSGKLVRISPNAFIYMTTETDDGGNSTPSCHLIFSTDSDHYVGGISTDCSDKNDCDVEKTDDDQDDNILLGDATPMDDTEDTDDNDNNCCDSSLAPVDQTDDNILVNPQPSDDLAQAVSEPIVTTLAPAVDVVNDQNDMIQTGLVNESDKCDDDSDKRCKDSSLDESAYIEYPHQVENLDEAIQQISTALTNRYGGTIILHEGHCLTHVRKDGLVDKVQAVSGKYKIRTQKINV